ncbi:MAG: peptidoglycan-associated lipoprotein Pal [Burkholderiales bacterium]|nr:peptidoglycan-associated lipoprotein Pal [Burkholderiales bacterium]
MRRIFVLLIASMVWGCASAPGTDDAAQAGVEDRTPGAGASGPLVTPLPPSKPQAQKPITGQAPGAATATAPLSPLKDPGNILSKRSIFYDYDSDAIKEEFRPLIQAHAKYLASNAGAKMLIQGNCDERGSREYNIALGQRRAEAVKRMLVLLGAREAQIEAVSLGEEKPRCTDQTEQCMAQNRRSDLLYGGEF